ncbi:MAG TPA: hypothetical protein VKJ45_13280 [Blastocatellia bacterium]|jgi:hypothetical protein|nr:hypothetical protein [Blastocatellia bacterium]
MSESIELREPLYKLSIRFSNGELLNFLVRDLIDSRMITTETRYAVISSVSIQDPSQCIDSTVVNLRDVTFIRTERVTLDQLAAEHRMAGIRSGNRSSFDDKLLKTLSHLKFV